MVSISELGVGLKELGVVSTVLQLQLLTQEIDENKDGTVTFEEFLAAAAEHDILRTQVFTPESPVIHEESQLCFALRQTRSTHITVSICAVHRSR